MTKNKLLESIFQAGVVGCGGAGFPTHRKLESQVEYFIVNGAECEPLLGTDRYLMRTFSMTLVNTAHEIGMCIGASKIRIALKKTYRNEIAALQEAIDNVNSNVELFLLEHFYPAGDEQIIVREVTGRIVPPAGIPPEVGVTVSNVATVLAVADSMEGKNFTHRTMTVTGDVQEPIILRVPLGTSFSDCIKQAGGPTVSGYSIISGGPMMGKILHSDSLYTEVVTKTTSGIILISDEKDLVLRDDISLKHMINRARSSCIQCSFCTQLCPRYLNGHPIEPHKIMRKLAYSIEIEDVLEDEIVKQALICCECGVCEKYACPMMLQPKRINMMIKAAYAKKGIRYQRTHNEWKVREESEYRSIPTDKIIYRLGLSEYKKREIRTMIDYTPERVEIPLHQHIGIPAVAVVKTGDQVNAGQIIGACPKNAMGANIHASIKGIVIAVGERIIIERMEMGR